ncbi:MAG: HigA family addiction module antidote protein [Alphaproteobacteria bacterium]|nr:HigA family addiction module antidote protein [Alphaproteobacteria bacterium]
MIGPIPPVHPGEILREEFLIPLDITPYAVARACMVPRTRIERLAREETPVTADTALRLGRYFKTGPEFWVNLQAMYDLVVASQSAPEIIEIKPRDNTVSLQEPVPCR